MLYVVVLTIETVITHFAAPLMYMHSSYAVVILYL